MLLQNISHSLLVCRLFNYLFIIPLFVSILLLAIIIYLHLFQAQLAFPINFLFLNVVKKITKPLNKEPHETTV